MQIKKIIVIGMSAASVSFVVKLRSLDKQCQIICFSAEADVPYNRCHLADFLTRDMQLEEIFLKPETFFVQQNIELHLNTRVTRIDIAKNTIYVGDSAHGYDYLFLGVGSSPCLLPCQRAQPSDNVFTFHALQDMENIKKYIKNHRVKVACVVGGGINGLEAASSLRFLGISVVVVEAKLALLSGLVDNQAAQWILYRAQLNGVTVLTDRRVVNFHKKVQSDLVSDICLDGGSTINVDMVIVAIGSAVNQELIKGTEIKTQDGAVVVDDYMQTNVGNVFAGGDVCMVKHMVSSVKVRSVTWSDAMLQGLCAAVNVAHLLSGIAKRAYPGAVGIQDSYLFGKAFYVCMRPMLNDKECEIIQRAVHGNSLKILYTTNKGILVGFVLIGDLSGIEEYKKWYVTQQIIDVSKIQ